MPFFELLQASKRFGSHTAMEGVSLGVERGERFGLLGPGGAGKTTLLRAAAGLDQLDGGEVRLEQRVLSSKRSSIPPEKRQMGMVFQTLGLWSHLSAREHLDLVLRPRMPAAAERGSEIESLLALARLNGKAGRRPGELSGGERQRLALVRALAPQPKILLLDEPFAHVDAPLRDDLAADLVALIDSFGATVLLVSHDGAHAAAVCHRIGVLDEGRLVQTGSPRDVYESPKTRVVAQMLGTAFFVEGEAAGGAAETAIGGVALCGRVAQGKGWVCLRPESFILQTPSDAASCTPSSEATVVNSTFIAGRWRVHFRFAESDLWTWADAPRSAGDSIRIALAPAAWIAHGR